MYAQRIVALGNRFLERLDPDLVRGALDYVDHNEEGLAFEILCDHISEYDVSISAAEYEEIVGLISDLGFSLEDGPFKHLKGLVS